MPNNLRDGNILRDFGVFLNSYGMIGTCPSFSPPEIKVQVEEFRGGGMDAVVEVPMGIEKLECEFDLHVWDQAALSTLGFGPGRQDVILRMAGYLLSPLGTEQPAEVVLQGFVREMNAGKIEPGSKSEWTIAFSAHYYHLMVAGEITTLIDIYNKSVQYGAGGGIGVGGPAGDVQQTARGMVGFDG